MVSELRDLISADKIFFGQRECMKNVKKINKVFVPIDARESIVAHFEKNGVAVERLDSPKYDVCDKLDLDFSCEIFGAKK